MSRKLISVDIEADGPYPGTDGFSMVSFGAVIVEDGLLRQFYSEVRPISPKWDAEALSVSGFSRKQTMEFAQPEHEMLRFAEWITQECPDGATFIADNPGFDFAFINYYFHRFHGKNPFGWSSRRISDLFCGVKNNYYYQWKKHRKTKHTHSAIDDAVGNAEALLYLRDELCFKLPK